MKSNRTFVKLTTLALLLATMTVYAANRAGAARANAAPPATVSREELEEAVTFTPGAIGIGPGQIASIHAVLIGMLDTERAVEVEFTFHDPDGNVLASSRQALLAGRATSFDTRGIIAILRSKRIDIIPSVRVLANPTDPNVNLIVPTFEVFDTATGKTQVALVCRKAGGS